MRLLTTGARFGVLLILLCSFGWAQGPFNPVTANRLTRGSGAPSAGLCATSADVGKVYARRDPAATASTLYVCSNTGVATYTWELQGGGSGSGTVNSGTLGQLGYYAATGTAISATGSGTFFNPTALATPSAPTVTNVGTPGSTTYGYEITFVNSIGWGVGSAEGTTATGNATLSGSNKNRIASPTCPTGVGVSSYKIARSTGGATQGYIGTQTCGVVFDDTGIAAVGDVPFLWTVDTSTGSMLTQLRIPWSGASFIPAILIGTPIDQTDSRVSGNNEGSMVSINYRGDLATTNGQPVFIGQSDTGNQGGTVFQLMGYIDGQGSGGNERGMYALTGGGVDSTGSIDSVITISAGIDNRGSALIGTASVFYAANYSSGPITTYQGFYNQAVGGTATNAYSFWSDEQGVYRIRSDNTFDSVYQSIPALYNPQFTKYTPGAANYERVVEQWNGNVAEIGTEKGGTGTLRNLRLIGTQVLVNSLKTTGAATGKTVVCVDVATGQLYASTSGVACAN